MHLVHASALSTDGYASHLSWKQGDILACLGEGGCSTRGLAEVLDDCLSEDLADNRAPKYWGTSYESVYSTLQTLKNRGLVFLGVDKKWYLTQRGREAERQIG